MAHLTKKANRKLHADLSNIKGFNVKLKRSEVIQNPREVTFKNGRKAIAGIGSDGTKIFRIISG